MITLRVKTLSGGDHPFVVDESMNIEAFKREIESIVNISPENQRIIYMGRALENSQILRDLDLDGKVVHLVARLPPSETPDANSPQSAPANLAPGSIGGRLQFFNMLNFTDPDSVFARTQTAVEQALTNSGQFAFVHSRRSDSSRNFEMEVNVAPTNSISEINYRVFIAKKFVECAERVLSSLESDNNDDNFTDLDYMNEEQRISFAESNEQRQLSVQFRNSSCMEFYISLFTVQNHTFNYTFLNEMYSSIHALIGRYCTVNNRICEESSLMTAESLSRYETRRNRFSHYLAHSLHDLSELTTTINDSQYRMVPTERFHDHPERTMVGQRMRDRMSRLTRLLHGTSSVTFPRESQNSSTTTEQTQQTTSEQSYETQRPGRGLSRSTQARSDEGTTRTQQTTSEQRGETPTSREMRTSSFNIDTVVDDAIQSSIINRPNESDNPPNLPTWPRRTRNPFRRIYFNEPPPNILNGGFIPMLNRTMTNRNTIHTQLDPFLQCHSYCCETEMPNYTSFNLAAAADTHLGGTRSTAPSTSSMFVQQDSESEFPRSTNFSDSANLPASLSFDDDSDSHSQSVITVPDDSAILIIDQTIQNNLPYSEQTTIIHPPQNDNQPTVSENQQTPIEEAWMRDVPSEWVGVISNDQTVQANTDYSQRPFSDGYISGMPAKRQRVIEEEKARNGVSSAEDLVSIISSASQNAMIEPLVPLSNMTSVVQADESLMNSFHGFVKEKVRKRLDNDPNFDPERYPAAGSL